METEGLGRGIAVQALFALDLRSMWPRLSLGGLFEIDGSKIRERLNVNRARGVGTVSQLLIVDIQSVREARARSSFKDFEPPFGSYGHDLTTPAFGVV